MTAEERDAIAEHLRVAERNLCKARSMVLNIGMSDEGKTALLIAAAETVVEITRARVEL